MAFFRRKGKDPCPSHDVESSDIVLLEKENTGKDNKEAVKKGKDNNSKTWFHDLLEWVVIFVVCFGGFYSFAFTGKERAYHKKQMDAQLEELAKKFEAQKVSLSAQLDGLYQQLFAAEQASKASAAEGATSTDAQPQAPELSAEEQRIQDELARKKAEQEAKRVKVASFCAQCPFNKDGLSTTCGRRKDYILQKYGGDNESIILAVIDLDSGCSYLN